MREVITIQLGEFANTLGTRFWNTQNAYFSGPQEAHKTIDHDVLFRVGENLSQEATYTPRLVLVDHKRSLGKLNSGHNKLYWEPEPQTGVLWGEGEETIPTASVVPTGAGNTWTTDLQLFLHPKSLVQIRDPLPSVSPRALADILTHQEVSQLLEDVVEQNIRFFAEECDLLQGIQLFTSTSDLFGDFATRLTTQIQESYPRISVLALAEVPSHEAGGLARLRELSDCTHLVVPLARPSEATKEVQWAAPVAAAYDSLSFLWRVKDAGQRLDTACERLAMANRSHKFAKMAARFPLGSNLTRDWKFNDIDFKLSSQAADLDGNSAESSTVVYSRLLSIRSSRDVWKELSELKAYDDLGSFLGLDGMTMRVLEKHPEIGVVTSLQTPMPPGVFEDSPLETETVSLCAHFTLDSSQAQLFGDMHRFMAQPGVRQTLKQRYPDLETDAIDTLCHWLLDTHDSYTGQDIET